METAKKLLKKKDGFTLVELIVVLVILASDDARGCSGRLR